MISIFDAVIDCFQGLLIAWFLKKVLEDGSCPRVTVVISGILTGALLILWEALSIPLPDTLIYVIPLIYALCFLNGSVFVKLLWLMIVILTFGTTAQITTGIFLFFTSPETLYGPGPTHAAYCLTANALTAAAFVMIIRITSGGKAVLLGRRNVCLFLVCYALEAAAEEVLYIYQTVSGDTGIYMLCMNIALAGITGLTMVLQDTMALTIQRKQEAEALSRIWKASGRHQKEIEAIYHEVLANQHTLRHQIDIIKSSAAYTSDPDTAELVHRLDQQAEGPLRFATGCTAVDALLAAKQSTARQRHIDLDMELCPLSEHPDITAFCVILSNLLDNAIEATDRITDPDKKRKISLEITRSWDMLYLRCVNTMDPSTLRYENNALLSSKQTPRLHGYGLASIRDLTDHLQGSCTIRPCPEEALFIVQISLPIDKKTGNSY